MKLGILSDIHANVVNLRRALTLLRERGADAIVCAGDLVDGETEGNAVVELIRAQGIACVQGNHDHALAGATAAQYDEWRQFLVEEGYSSSLGNADDTLTGDSLNYLRDLPLTHRLELEGKRILVTHASTWDQTTYCYPNGQRETLTRIAAEARAEAADIVILGHTHVPMAVEVGGVWVFNPGSVDGNRHDPYASTCALLDLPQLRYQVFDLATGKPTLYQFARIDLERHEPRHHAHSEGE